LLLRPEVYRKLEHLGQELADGLTRSAGESGTPLQVKPRRFDVNRVFHRHPGPRLQDGPHQRHGAARPVLPRAARSGVYFAPSQFETCFISLAHTGRDIAATIRAARQALKE